MPNVRKILGIERSIGKEANPVRNVHIRRCLYVSVCLGTWCIRLWIGSATKLEAQERQDVPTDKPVASSDFAVSDDSLKPRALVLPLQGEKSRWTLPIDGPRDGWLIAVGVSDYEGAGRSVKLSVKAGDEPIAKFDYAPVPSIEARRSIPASSRHVVARPRSVSNDSFSTRHAARRRFGIQTGSGNSNDPAFYETVYARLAITGTRVAVYVDERDREEVDRETLEMIVRTMDVEIPAKVVTRIGDAADVDGDGRMTILMSRALGRMADGTAVLDGFVRPADFETGGTLPRSHTCDMIYINSRVKAGPFLKSLLAHEFTHAVTASARIAAAPDGVYEPEHSWLDEGLAHLSERWVEGSWQNMDYRISSYFQNTHEHRLVVNDEVGLSAGREHGHRGASFLFLSWCEREFGAELPGRLIASSKVGISNLEETTEMPFAELYRAWTVDQMRQAATLGSLAEIRDRALLDDWLVAVPRATELSAGLSVTSPEEVSWTAQGTTFRLFRIVAGSDEAVGRNIELTLEVSSHTGLQVTALPLLDSHQGLSMEVVECDIETGDAFENSVRLRLTNRDDERPVTLQAASWEAEFQGGDPQIFRGKRGFIDLLSLSETLGSITLRPGQSILSAPIRVQRMLSPAIPMRWKVVAHDDKGKPIFTWAEFLCGASDQPSRPPRLAGEIVPDRPNSTRR